MGASMKSVFDMLCVSSNTTLSLSFVKQPIFLNA